MPGIKKTDEMVRSFMDIRKYIKRDVKKRRSLFKEQLEGLRTEKLALGTNRSFHELTERIRGWLLGTKRGFPRQQ